MNIMGIILSQNSFSKEDFRFENELLMSFEPINPGLGLFFRSGSDFGWVEVSTRVGVVNDPEFAATSLNL